MPPKKNGSGRSWRGAVDGSSSGLKEATSTQYNAQSPQASAENGSEHRDQNPLLHSPQASADISQEHNALGQTTSLHSPQVSAATGHEHLGQHAQAYAPSAEGSGRGLASAGQGEGRERSSLSPSTQTRVESARPALAGQGEEQRTGVPSQNTQTRTESAKGASDGGSASAEHGEEQRTGVPSQNTQTRAESAQIRASAAGGREQQPSDPADGYWNLPGESQARFAPRRSFQLPAYQAGPPEGPLAPPRIGPNGKVYMDRREVMFGLSGRISSPQQLSNWEMFMTQDLTRDAVTPWGPQPSQAPRDQTDDRPRPAKRQRRNPGSNIDAGKNKRKRDDSAPN